MKINLTRCFLFLVVFSSLVGSSCSSGNGGTMDGKDNENRGNHAIDPREPSDAEYPGSKTYDSLHPQKDSAAHK